MGGQIIEDVASFPETPSALSEKRFVNFAYFDFEHSVPSHFGMPVFRQSVRCVCFVMVLLSGPVPAREVDWNRLHLTPEQESRIHQLEDSWEKTHSDVASRIEQDASELRAILPTGDAQRIRQLQNRITANKMFLMNQSMDIFLQKRNTLTPEQRLQLRKMLPARCRRSR